MLRKQVFNQQCLALWRDATAGVKPCMRVKLILSLQAQHTALLGCIEESERVRIQTEHADCMSMHKLCIGSPSAHSEWGYQLSCKSTDDSAYGGDIERGSHLSSSTPSAHRPSLGEQQSTFHTPVLISSPAQQESIR